MRPVRRRHSVNEAFEEEENANARSQRQRIDENEKPVFALKLTDLIDNVLTQVMSFLPFIDMNEFAMCSQRCREIRAHDSLDQTRAGTIVIKPNSSMERFANALMGHSRGFTGNRKHLFISGSEHVPRQNWNIFLPTLGMGGPSGVVQLEVMKSDVLHHPNEYSQKERFRMTN